MSLINAKADFVKYFSPGDPSYVGDITTSGAQARIDAANRVRTAWKEALETKLPGIVPASSSVSAAVSAFESAYDGETLASFQAAMSAMASSLGSGMADVTLNPPLGYSATPPAALFLPTTTTDNYDTLCQELDTQLDTWLKTGTATNNSTSATVNWS